MEIKARFVWEEYISYTKVEAKKLDWFYKMLSRLEEMKKQLANLEKIIEFYKTKQEWNGVEVRVKLYYTKRKELVRKLIQELNWGADELEVWVYAPEWAKSVYLYKMEKYVARNIGRILEWLREWQKEQIEKQKQYIEEAKKYLVVDEVKVGEEEEEKED